MHQRHITTQTALTGRCMTDLKSDRGLANSAAAPTQNSGAKKRKNSQSFSNAVLLAALGYGVAGVGAALLFASGSSFWRDVSLSTAIFGAAGAIGSFAGFLFAVPRYQQTNSEAKKAATAEVTSHGQSQPPVALYQRNSNLEQVSDWLTKIIVGVGLVEFRKILEALGSLGVTFGAAFNSRASSTQDTAGRNVIGEVFGLGLAVVGAGVGFMLMYMWAQIRLFKVMDESDDQ